MIYVYKNRHLLIHTIEPFGQNKTTAQSNCPSPAWSVLVQLSSRCCVTSFWGCARTAINVILKKKKLPENMCRLKNIFWCDLNVSVWRFSTAHLSFSILYTLRRCLTLLVPWFSPFLSVAGPVTVQWLLCIYFFQDKKRLFLCIILYCKIFSPFSLLTFLCVYKNVCMLVVCDVGKVVVKRVSCPLCVCVFRSSTC